MKIKRTICALALMLCLGTAAVLLTACGGGEVASLFGQTLSFYGYANISEYSYTVENKTMELGKLVRDYFDKIDWQATLGKSKAEVQNAGNAINLMTDYIYQDINETALKAIKFEFSSEEASKVTVDGKEYEVNAISLYEYKFKTGQGEEEITVRYERDNTFIYVSNILENSALPNSATNSVTIRFLEPTEIINGQTGDLNISGRVLYKA